MAAIVATFTTIGYLMGFVGCIVDGIAAAVIVGIQVCGGGDSFSPTITSVSATAQVDILSCIIQNTGNDIVCTDANNCYFYNGHGTDPSIVQGQYLSLVRACTAFDVILTVVLFFTALLAYAAICCPQCLGSVPAVVNQQKNTVIVVQGVHEESSPVATVYDPSTGKVINDGV